jgi:hypothetical protein
MPTMLEHSSRSHRTWATRRQAGRVPNLLKYIALSLLVLTLVGCRDNGLGAQQTENASPTIDERKPHVRGPGHEHLSLPGRRRDARLQRRRCVPRQYTRPGPGTGYRWTGPRPRQHSFSAEDPRLRRVTHIFLTRSSREVASAGPFLGRLVREVACEVPNLRTGAISLAFALDFAGLGRHRQVL